MSYILPVFVRRWCVECGQMFLAKTELAMVCSPRCQMRRWRATKMLEGTHGYNRDGRFVRLRRREPAA